MTKPLIAALAAASLSIGLSSAFARGTDDAVLLDLQGKIQDAIQKRGADNAGVDLRGKGSDVLLKRGGADNAGIDLRGRAGDLIQKRGGTDDPPGHDANQIRRAPGNDDVAGHHRMEHARGHR